MTTQRRTSMFQSKPQNKEGYSNLPPRQNFTAIIKEIHLSNPKKGNPAEDYMIVAPECDIPSFGLTNVRDAEGNLTKTIKVMTTPLKENKPENKPYNPDESFTTTPQKEKKPYKRRELFDLTRKLSGGSAMAVDSRVYFEKSFYNKKTNTVMTYSPHGDATKEEIENEVRVSFPGVYACVLPEVVKNNKGSQDVLVALTDNGVVVTSREDLNELAGQMLSPGENTLTTGVAGVQLRAYKLAPSDFTEEEAVDFAGDISTRKAVFSIAYEKNVKDQETNSESWVQQNPEEFMDRLLSINPEFEELLNDKDWMVEFVPMLVFKQVKSRLPSNAEGKYDASVRYRFYEKPTNNKNDFGVGWSMSNVLITRFSETGTFFQSSYQNTTDALNQKVYTLDDLPTVNMPEYHKVAVNKIVEAYVKNAGIIYENNKSTSSMRP
jgi:hypothetical protein